MTDPGTPRHIEIKDGDHTIATAKVMTCEEAAGIARVWLQAAPGHVTPGRQASLADAVMDLPEVWASSRLEATIPLGDTELLERLRQRTHDAVTRPVGCTALLDADIPPPGRKPASSVAEGSPADLPARPSPRAGPAVVCGPVLGDRVARGLSSDDASRARADSLAGTWPQAGRDGLQTRRGSQPGTKRPGPAPPRRLAGPRSRGWAGSGYPGPSGYAELVSRNGACRWPTLDGKSPGAHTRAARMSGGRERQRRSRGTAGCRTR
jgi:hypothetical protein